MATGGKVSNELLNNSLKLPKDLVHPQGARVPNAPVIGPETTVSCCRPISTPQILPVLPLPLFPGWDLQIFQGVFLIMSSSPKGEKGRCVSVGTPYFHNFTPASPHHPPSSTYFPFLLGSFCPFLWKVFSFARISILVAFVVSLSLSSSRWCWHWCCL